MTAPATLDSNEPVPATVPEDAPTPPSRLARILSVRNIGGVYVFLALIVFFTILEPDKFATAQTAKTILNQYSVTGLIALCLIVPLAAGLFDLSVGATVGFSSMLTAILVGKTEIPIPLVVILVLLAALTIGLMNAAIVVMFKIDSFIATLGSGAIITALTIGISDNKTITGGRLGGSFSEVFARADLAGITIPVLYFLILMVILGIVLEQTSTGRFWYALGFDTEAARLAGVRVKALRASTLVISASIAGFAGIVLTARVASSAPGSGEPYLLPAFAAAFLGATQFRSGRFNAWGTALAVILVGTANYGLLLASAPQWAPNVFTGAILIVAVGITGLERRGPKAKARRVARADTPTSEATT